MIPVVYHPRYNITAFGLERLHPFDGRKYGRIRDWLVRQGLRSRGDFLAPQPITTADLLRLPRVGLHRLPHATARGRARPEVHRSLDPAIHRQPALSVRRAP